MQIVPASEIAARLAMLQALLTKNGADAAVIRQNADLFYFTGTVQDAHLIIPSSGNPVLMVRRSHERALAESPLRPIVAMSKFGELRQALFDACGTAEPKVLGFELDVLPAKSFFYYDEKLFPSQQIVDISMLIRQVRMIKSTWEIDMMRRAAEISTLIAESVPRILKPGMREIDLHAEVEAISRKAGDTGFVHTRSFNIEMILGHIISGPNAAVPSYTDTPTGGPGLTPAFGQGAGYRQIEKGEIVSVDVAVCKDGYLNDQTRNFSIGPPAGRLADAYEFVKSAHQRFRQIAKPGVIAGEIYKASVKWAEEAGWGEWFMGHAEPRINFVGHGLGIELDELPPISDGSKTPLVEGMVFAFEPKVIIPGEGLAGLENTYVVTSTGVESLNPASEELIIV